MLKRLQKKKWRTKIAAGILLGSTLFLGACSNDQTEISDKIHAQLANAETQQLQNLSNQSTTNLITSTESTPLPTQQATQQTLAVPNKGQIPIIMFHYVRTVDQSKDPLGYNLSITPTSFEKILQYLSNQGYHTIHVEDLLKEPVAKKDIILTFDDGYEDFFTTARPLLKKYGFTASEAIITGKIDGTTYMSPRQIQTIDQEGFEILSHTVNHVDLDTDPHQKTEIVDSKTYLEKLLNKPIDTLVYPSGRYNNETLQLDKEAGYKIGLTTKPGYANLEGDLLQLHRIRIDNRDGFLGFVKKLTLT